MKRRGEMSHGALVMVGARFSPLLGGKRHAVVVEGL